jgi:hypothetical protein
VEMGGKDSVTRVIPRRTVMIVDPQTVKSTTYLLSGASAAMTAKGML